MNRRHTSSVDQSKQKLFLDALRVAFSDPARTEIVLKATDGRRRTVTRREAELYLAAGNLRSGSPARNLLNRDRVKRLRAMVDRDRAERNTEALL